jgi:diketogulonate reductase-like aldo/keto reductase
MRRESLEAALEAKKACLIVVFYNLRINYLQAGRIRSIGVSNFGVDHLKEIVEGRGKEDWPSVNQVRFPSHYLRN